MARIKEFFQTQVSSKLHPTEVECGYQRISTPDGDVLQLSTYGSDDRQSEKKTSQTLQLDKQRAAELVEIIRSTFPELR
jgi:5-methylcytosine-specific restriction protein B